MKSGVLCCIKSLKLIPSTARIVDVDVDVDVGQHLHTLRYNCLISTGQLSYFP